METLAPTGAAAMADAREPDAAPIARRRSRSPRSWMGERERQPAATPPTPPEHCPACTAILPRSTRLWRLRVCPTCQHHLRLPARDRIATLVDDGSFRETGEALVSLDPLAFHDDRPYRDRLHHQQSMLRQHDAMVTGTATIGGHEVVLAVLDFAFMGGSMGIVVGEKLAVAAELARRRKLPLVTVVASGGARMQEGMFSLWQMAHTAAAVRQLRTGGVPCISVLTDPTTGGVLASFASLADVILAEPNALIGFAGPRVAEALTGQPLPPGSHRAEYLLRCGHIDAVVPRPALRATLVMLLSTHAAVLRVDEHPVRTGSTHWTADPETALPDPWALTQAVRDPDRPSGHDYIQRIVTDFMPLAGDRVSGDDRAVIGGMGRIGELPVMVIALDRGHRRFSVDAPLHPLPQGFRKAHRLMALAARWRLPVVMLIDTPGAWPGIEAEQDGLAGSIAQCLALLADLPTPTISVTVGEGGSGGALALAVADRMLIQERAVFSVIAPEGAAAILHRDVGRAPELAASMRITARDLLAFGMVDGIVGEPAAGAASDPDAAATLLEAAIVASLDELRRYDVRHLVRRRYDRVRGIGHDAIGFPSRRDRARSWLRRRVSRAGHPLATGRGLTEG